MPKQVIPLWIRILYLLVIVFAPFVISAYFIRIAIAALYIENPWLMNTTIGNGTPAIFGGRLSFNYVGFLLPLVVSLLLVTFWTRSVREKPDRRTSLIFLAAVALTFSFSTLITPLLRIDLLGGGTDMALAMITPFYLTKLVYDGRNRSAIALAYPLGFFIMALSDFEALPHFSGVAFGGFAFFDGDFYLPIALLSGIVIAVVVAKRLKLTEFNLSEP